MKNERLDAIIAKATANSAAIEVDAIRAAYELGFDDGIDHVAQTARNARSPHTSPTSVIATTVPVAARENPFRQEQAAAPKRAPYGLCRRAIAESFKQAGEAGIDLDVVSETGFHMEGGPKLAASSVRSTLIEMAKEGLVERRNGRWFLVRSETETAGRAHEANPAAPLFNSDGDSREQAPLTH